jgi:hypothetical protein
LDAYYLAVIFEPALEVLLCCVFAVAFHVHLGVAGSS